MKRRVLIPRKLLEAPALLDLIFVLQQRRSFQYVFAEMEMKFS